MADPILIEGAPLTTAHSLTRYVVLSRMGLDKWSVQTRLFESIEEAGWYCRGFLPEVTAIRVMAISLPIAADVREWLPDSVSPLLKDQHVSA